MIAHTEIGSVPFEGRDTRGAVHSNRQAHQPHDAGMRPVVDDDELTEVLLGSNQDSPCRYGTRGNLIVAWVDGQSPDQTTS